MRQTTDHLVGSPFDGLRDLADGVEHFEAQVCRGIDDRRDHGGRQAHALVEGWPAGIPR